MKHTCCFESPLVSARTDKSGFSERNRFYRGWILFVVLLGIEVSVEMGIASKGSTAEHSSQVLPLLEKQFETFRGTSFRLTSAVGTQMPLIEQSEMPAIEKHQGPLNIEPTKSPTKAFLYSALVPGSGQLYIGAKRGYLQIAVDAGLLAAYFITRSNAQSLREDYREQVRDHVIFEGPTKFDDWDPIEDFEHATLFDNWHNVYTDNNGEPLDRVGKWYWEDRKAFKDESRKTHDSPQRMVAKQLRLDANDKFQLAKTFLGIAILNHVVSAVDARIAAKSYNKKHRSFELNLQTSFSPRNVQSQLVLQKRF